MLCTSSVFFWAGTRVSREWPSARGGSGGPGHAAFVRGEHERVAWRGRRVQALRGSQRGAGLVGARVRESNAGKVFFPLAMGFLGGATGFFQGAIPGTRQRAQRRPTPALPLLLLTSVLGMCARAPVARGPLPVCVHALSSCAAAFLAAIYRAIPYTVGIDTAAGEPPSPPNSALCPSEPRTLRAMPPPPILSRCHDAERVRAAPSGLGVGIGLLILFFQFGRGDFVHQ
jgi:hypothetical protein